jgi:hypothetical protein
MFVLAEPRRYDLSADDTSKWKAVPYDKTRENETIKVVEDAWIYVFQQSLAPTTPKLFRVLFAKAGGSTYYAWTDPDEVKADPLIVTMPTENRRIDVLHSFPDRFRTNQYFYFFYVSRVPLHTAEIIRELEDGIEAFCPRVNLPDVGGPADIVIDLKLMNVRGSVLHALDPITIMEGLHERYEKACDEYIKFHAVTDDMSESEREQTRHRAVKGQIGRSIKRIIESDSDDKLDIDDREEVLARIKTYVDAVDQDSEKLRAVRDAIAKEIVKWSNGPAWKFLRDSYIKAPKWVLLSKWIAVASDAAARLSESNPGKAMLFDWVLNKKEFVVSELMFGDAPLEEAQVEAVETAMEKTLNLFSETIPEMIAHDQKHGGAKLAAALNHLRAVGTFIARTDPEGVLIKLNDGNTIETTKIYPQIVEMTKAPANIKAVQLLESVLALVNLGTTAAEARFVFHDINAVPIDAVAAALKTGWGAGAAGKALGKALGAGETQTVRWVGRYGTMFGIAFAATDAWKKLEQGDYDAIGGDAMIGVGLFVELLVDLGALGPVWGIVAAIFAVLGAVVVAALTDSDINTFVKNTPFGRNRNKLPDSKPKWSPTNTKEWTDTADGLAKLFEAFMHIVSGFEVERLGKQVIRIRPRGFLSGSKIEIKEFKATFETAPGRERVIEGGGTFDIDSLKLVVSDSKASGLLEAASAIDGKGRYIDVSISIPGPIVSVEENQSAMPPKLMVSKCALRMILGQANSTIPIKDFVELDVYDHLAPSAAKVSSNEFD